MSETDTSGLDTSYKLVFLLQETLCKNELHDKLHYYKLCYHESTSHQSRPCGDYVDGFVPETFDVDLCYL